MAEKTTSQRLIEINNEQKAIEAEMEFIDDHLGDGDRDMKADEAQLKKLQAQWNELDKEKDDIVKRLKELAPKPSLRF